MCQSATARCTAEGCDEQERRDQPVLPARAASLQSAPSGALRPHPPESTPQVCAPALHIQAHVLAPSPPWLCGRLPAHTGQMLASTQAGAHHRRHHHPPANQIGGELASVPPWPPCPLTLPILIHRRCRCRGRHTLQQCPSSAQHIGGCPSRRGQQPLSHSSLLCTRVAVSATAAAAPPQAAGTRRGGGSVAPSPTLLRAPRAC